MFWKRKRDGMLDNGFYYENVDELYYLKRIAEKQDEILKVLKNIDYKILDCFCDEKDKKINKMHEIIREGGFKKSQLDALSKLIKLSRELPDEAKEIEEYD